MKSQNQNPGQTDLLPKPGPHTSLCSLSKGEFSKYLRNSFLFPYQNTSKLALYEISYIIRKILPNPAYFQ